MGTTLQIAIHGSETQFTARRKWLQPELPADFEPVRAEEHGQAPVHLVWLEDIPPDTVIPLNREVFGILTTPSFDLARKAMQAGVRQVFVLPNELPDLIRTLDESHERLAPEVQGDGKSEMVGGVFVLGTSSAIKSAIALARRFASAPRTPVLITGETGTGKQLFARAIHGESVGTSVPFVEVNCSAIPQELLESELFGHERGAFTDAKTQKSGLLEVADGGTLFLDEISDMSPVLQAKILKVIEDQVFRRVGGIRDHTVHLRIIAATNRDLTEAVRLGRFRADLYFRLNVLQLRLPPLRERGNDSEEMAQAFLTQFSRQYSSKARRFTEAARQMIRNFAWPGNVRQLRNTVERSVILANSEIIPVEDLDLSSFAAGISVTMPTEPVMAPPPIAAARSLGEMEEMMVRATLERCRWNVSKAARELGITRDKLRYRMKRMGLL